MSHEPRFWVLVGLGVEMVAGGAALLWPASRKIGAVLLVAGLIVLVAIFFFWPDAETASSTQPQSAVSMRQGDRTSNSPNIVGNSNTVNINAAPLTTETPEPSNEALVYPAFLEAYRNNKPDLGEPRAPAQKSGAVGNDKIEHAYQALFTNGSLVFWMAHPSSFYVVTQDNKSWSIHDYAPSADRKYFDPRPLSAMFPMCRANHAPIGGVAKWLTTNHKRKLLGCVEWECNLDGNAVLYQQFGKGIVIGPLRSGAASGAYGNIFVLFDDHTFKTEVTTISPPACQQARPVIR
jgi:hypothetical protein